MNFDWNNPVLLIIAGAIPSLLIAYFAHRRAVRVDKTTEESGVASHQQGAIKEVVRGLNNLNTLLQQDNKILRESIKQLQKKVDEMTTQINNLRIELTRYVNGKL